MAVREVLKMGDPRLLAVAEPVADFDAGLRELVADLWETMDAYAGAGLAAPQIGVGRRVVVFGITENERYPEAPEVPPTALVNPVITPLGEETADGWEGCLSLPGLAGVVPRHTRIRYTGTTPEGEPIDREAEGFHARVVQHECDHLDGVLYPMRMPDLRQLGYVDALPAE